MNKKYEKKRNELINKIQRLPTNQISNAYHLFQTMVYSKGNQEGVIISSYLMKDKGII